MRIIIETVSGEADPLLAKIRKKISKEELKTWEIKINTEGEILFNHIPEQWSDRALLKPIEHGKGLQLKIRSWKGNEKPDEATKGYIIGRFVEILMVHFRKEFSHLEVR